MPNHYKKNVFPLFMDDREPVQEIETTGEVDWNGVTSRVLIKNGGDAVQLNLVAPETPGIMVEVGKDSGDFSCIVNMDPYGPFNNDEDFKTVQLQYGGPTTTDAAVFTCFWNGENWVPVGLTATT
jgi:hypothetical protein